MHAAPTAERRRRQRMPLMGAAPPDRSRPFAISREPLPSGGSGGVFCFSVAAAHPNAPANRRTGYPDPGTGRELSRRAEARGPPEGTARERSRGPPMAGRAEGLARRRAISRQSAATSLMIFCRFSRHPNLRLLADNSSLVVKTSGTSLTESGFEPASLRAYRGAGPAGPACRGLSVCRGDTDDLRLGG